MSILSNIKAQIKELLDDANEIYDSNLNWDEKYHLIFSKNISRKVFDLINLDYYDPDTSYEEDVTAFMTAFRETAERYLNED